MHIHVHAERTPDKPALRMAGSGLTVTFRELEERSNRVAHMLRALDLHVGDHIAILIENHPRYTEVCWGAQRSGIFYTAISTHLTANEAAYIVNDCGAKLLVTSRAMAAVAAPLRELAPGVRTWLMADQPIDGYASFESMVARHPATRIPDESAGGDMLYSSGTTGQPKGVFLPPESPEIDASTALARFLELFGIDDKTVYLSPGPLYHAAPLRFSLTTQRLGGTAIVMEHFDAEDFLRLIQLHRVTHTRSYRQCSCECCDSGRRCAHAMISARCAAESTPPRHVRHPSSSR
jgi:long-chain acyl-CoA synthetase